MSEVQEPNLLEWNLDNIPQGGLKHYCFAEKIGSLQDLADAIPAEVRAKAVAMRIATAAAPMRARITRQGYSAVIVLRRALAKKSGGSEMPRGGFAGNFGPPWVSDYADRQ